LLPRCDFFRASLSALDEEKHSGSKSGFLTTSGKQYFDCPCSLESRGWVIELKDCVAEKEMKNRCPLFTRAVAQCIAARKLSPAAARIHVVGEIAQRERAV